MVGRHIDRPELGFICESPDQGDHPSQDHLDSPQPRRDELFDDQESFLPPGDLLPFNLAEGGAREYFDTMMARINYQPLPSA